MKTADFLPRQIFMDHLDRRKTAKRIAVLCVFGLICLSANAAVEVETRNQERKALELESPRPEAQIAQNDLQALYKEISRSGIGLDPLTEHLSMPTVAWAVAGLAGAAGEDTGIEKIKWEHNPNYTSSDPKVPSGPRLVFTVTGKVRGQDALVSLEGLLQEFTGYETARTKAELHPDFLDVSKFEVELTTPLASVVPKPGQKSGPRKFPPRAQ